MRTENERDKRRQMHEFKSFKCEPAGTKFMLNMGDTSAVNKY